MLMYTKPAIVHLPNKFGVLYKHETSKNGKIEYHFLKFYGISPQAKMVELSIDESGNNFEAIQIINDRKRKINYIKNVYEEHEIGDSLENLGNFIVEISNLCR